MGFSPSCAGQRCVTQPSTGQGTPIPAPPSPGMPRSCCQLCTAGSYSALPLPWPGWQAVVQPRDSVASGQQEVTARRKARASSGAQLPQGPGRTSPFSHTGLARACPTCPSSSREGPTAARLCGDRGQGHRAVPAVSPAGAEASSVTPSLASSSAQGFFT